jgi:4-carboxymuconolactone decarboxylase
VGLTGAIPLRGRTICGAGTTPDDQDTVEDDVGSNYTERLRRLAVNEAGAAGEDVRSLGDPTGLDPKTLALVRLAALVAVGAAEPSFGEQTDAAVSAGASADEIVDVLIGVCTVVGVPRVVAAAPKLALALGHDLDDLDDPHDLRD